MKKKEKLICLLLCANILVNIIFIFLPHKNNINVERKKLKIDFFLESKEDTIEVNDIYQKKGVTFKLNHKDKNDKIIINQSNFKNNVLGEYFILYEAPISNYRKEVLYKKIKVIDTVKPRLTLKGDKIYYVSLGKEYKEPGYEAIDNYDGDITDKVQIRGDVNTRKEGTYKKVYTVIDQSGNIQIEERTIIVKENISEKEEDPIIEDIDVTQYNNTITNLEFTDSGIYVEGYVKKSNQKFDMIISNKSEKKFPMKRLSKNHYAGEIKLSSFANGTYNFYIKSKRKEKVEVHMDFFMKIVRAHIADKLVTMIYKDDILQMRIEKFKYQYDIVIDPGHGGFDTGAVANGVKESTINLEQSLYEKKRYEDHGLKVKLLREDDTYGEMMGKDDWNPINRRAYTVGYYGAVSKITYSNHHNSINDPTFMGYEVLVPCKPSYKQLAEVHQIIETWNQIYPISENHIRMYARNYDTDVIYNKINGQIYDFKDYYAVNRIPYRLYHTIVPIYEGSYMSHEGDFEYYYKNQNYKKMSEAKIKVYVESLGIPYKKVGANE